MSSLNMKANDRIQGWNCQQQQVYPTSNNMLRVLQNKILNVARKKQKIQFTKSITSKIHNNRPATVRVRGISSTSTKYEQFLSHPTIDLCNYDSKKIDDSNQLPRTDRIDISIKFRNKSTGYNITRMNLNSNVNFITNNQNTNKQNQTNGRQQYQSNQPDKIKQKYKTQQLQIKKQSLIFKNCFELKSKNSQKIINNFHEMQIKLRKTRVQNNRSMQNHKQKIHIIMEPTGKISQVTISKNHMENVTNQNIFQLGLDKNNEPNYYNYTKLSRKNKLILTKDGKISMKIGKRQKDIFTDLHFH